MLQTFGTGKPVVGSDDLTMMRALLREWCAGHGCHEESPEAVEVAKQLIHWFQIGHTQKWQLHELLNSRHRS